MNNKNSLYSNMFNIAFLKNKKVVCFIFLFFIISGLVIPQIGLGAGVGIEVTDTVGWFLNQTAAGGIFLWDNTVGPTVNWVWDNTVGAILGAIGTQVMQAILEAIGCILYYAFAYLSSAATQLFDLTIKLLDSPITSNAAFTRGWVLVRDLSNMIIVLGFVIVGIATALRIREYEAKKLLAPLIIMAILINFSGLLVGLIIDGSNILTKGIISGGGMQNVGADYQRILVTEGAKISVKNKAYASNVTKYFADLFAMAFCFLIVAITFFYLSFIFVARYAIFAFLYVLAPLAFVCKIFPLSATKKIWDEWWSNLLKWAFIGAGGALILNISSGVISSSISSSPAGTAPLVIVMVFLIIGFKMIKNSSAMGASAVMGLAAGATGFALGASKKIAGAGWEKLGRLAPVRATRDKVNEIGHRIAERTGFLKEGGTAQWKSAKTAEARKQVDALRTSSSAGDKARFEQLVRTGRGSTGAAAIASANEHGDLAKIIDPNNTGAAGLNNINARVAYATQFGHERSDFEKKDYRLRGLDGKSVRKELEATGLTPAAAAAVSSTDPAYIAAQRRATRTQLEKNWGTMNVSDRASVDVADLDREFISHRSPSDLDAFRSLPAGHATRAHLRGLVGTPGSTLNTAIDPTTGDPVNAIEHQLASAITSGDISEQRRIRNLGNKLRSM